MMMLYKGFSARVEFDPDDQLFIGRLVGTTDVVGFHAETQEGIEAAFREAVDDYLAALKTARNLQKLRPARS